MHIPLRFYQNMLTLRLIYWFDKIIQLYFDILKKKYLNQPCALVPLHTYTGTCLHFQCHQVSQIAYITLDATAIQPTDGIIKL